MNDREEKNEADEEHHKICNIDECSTYHFHHEPKLVEYTQQGHDLEKAQNSQKN